MAVLYISEYAQVGRDAAGYLAPPVVAEPSVAEQTVNIGASSAASNAFNALTALVRIHTDAICSISFGASPTAVATKHRMAANTTEYFSVPIGASYKVAVITNT